MKKQYNSCYYSKIILCLLTVIGHSARLFTKQGIIYLGDSSIIEKIFLIIYGFHMPCFFFIAGLIYYKCYHENQKYRNSYSFVKNKAKRLLVPYYVIGLIYVTPIMVLLNFTDSNMINYFIKGIIYFQNNRHLWFLLYLFIYFIVIHFVFRNTKKIAIIIPVTILCYLTYILKIPYFSSPCFYFIFFIIGYGFNLLEKNIVLKNRYIIFLFLVYCLLSIINIVYLSAFTALLGILILLQLTKKINIKNPKLLKISEFLTEYSMGIYLFHPMIIYIIGKIVYGYDINKYIIFLTLILVSFAISVLFTFIIKKLKISFIIGEEN